MAEAEDDDFGMCTFTGKDFYPLEPRLEDIDIIDIAHSLSLLCRYAGHTITHYSVAQHSVYVARIVEWKVWQQARPITVAALKYASPEELEDDARRLALWGLLHDASEAYTGDFIRPVKVSALGHNFQLVERKLMELIAQRYGLEWPEPPEVTDVDGRICDLEKRYLMRRNRQWRQEGTLADSEIPRTVDFSQACLWSPALAEQQFLREFSRLHR